jgi:hypothetical protein
LSRTALRFLVGDLIEVLEHLLDRLIGPLGALQRVVGVGHIRLVVLVVMQAHRLLVDVRLERGVVVGERRKFKGHLRLRFIGRMVVLGDQVLTGDRARTYASARDAAPAFRRGRVGIAIPVAGCTSRCSNETVSGLPYLAAQA